MHVQQKTDCLRELKFGTGWGINKQPIWWHEKYYHILCGMYKDSVSKIEAAKRKIESLKH